MKPFFTILSDPHFGQLNFSSLIQLPLHNAYTYPYIFGTTDKWIHNAEQSQIKAVVGFATKLRDDLDGVRKGMTFSVSNGQVEGQVNRLKVLKRQMYGRASHELLKKRFLCPV